MRKIKKVVSVFLIFLLVFNRLFLTVVLAEDEPVQETVEVQSSPEPSPEAESLPQEEVVEVDNQAEVSNEVLSESVTGENTIEESPSPTCSPEAVDLEESPEPEVIGEEVEGLVVEEGPSPTPVPDSAVIETGDAVSVVSVENSVNTTEVGSSVLFQTLNVFVSGDIDLTSTPLLIADQIFNQNNDPNPVVNVVVVDAQNYAYVSNDVVSIANSGDNTIKGGELALIETGDAYSVVTLLNKVNTTIVDSTIHIVTINIFQTTTGNILLPEFNFESTEDSDVGQVEINNQAEVENNLESLSNTGGNTIDTGESEEVTQAEIETGSSQSVVNLVNLVNTNLIGVVFQYLSINVLGQWVGSFLGWNNWEALPGGESLALGLTAAGAGSSGQGSGNQTAIGNGVHLVNNVSSQANTGGNTIQSNNLGQASVKTGNAFSEVSLINLVNTNIVRSIGFFGFINIFGDFSGDIGGASLFATQESDLTEPVIEAQSESTGDSGPALRQEGGNLAITQHNNIGTHVLPGDTVTFFIEIQNTGTGKVYDVVLDLFLMDSDENLGGALFKIGDIDPGKTVKVTTGLVLSPNALPGDYLARALVTGVVGPGDTQVSAFADSQVPIRGGGLLPMIPGGTNPVMAMDDFNQPGEVLGTAADSSGLTLEQKLWLLLIGLVLAQVSLKGLKHKEELAAAWETFEAMFKPRRLAFRSFLLRLSTFFT